MGAPVELLVEMLSRAAEEILEGAGTGIEAHGAPSFAGVQAAITRLRTAEEREVALVCLGVRGGDRGVVPDLRTLFSFPEPPGTRRIARGLSRVAEWRRFAREWGRLRGRRGRGRSGPPADPRARRPDVTVCQTRTAVSASSGGG